jgi:tight adherence protein C
MPVGNLIAVAVLLIALILLQRAALGWRVRRRALLRTYTAHGSRTPATPESAARDTMLARWLARAGYRRPEAQAWFVSLTAAGVVVGLLISQTYRLVLFQQLAAAIENVPGSTGDMLLAVLQSGPWILFLSIALAPAMFVRTARAARVQAIEQDLPLALELLATMAEAGLGFDAAIARIVRAQDARRPLIAEMVSFQHDMLAGMSRTQALRQLARRVDVASLTGFTSALIQAEQVGASMAETLQHQAADLRQRRREQALLRSQALPVKLVFPLVICFLPGIFVSTLAPVVYQMLQVAGSVVRSAP